MPALCPEASGGIPAGAPGPNNPTTFSLVFAVGLHDLPESLFPFFAGQPALFHHFIVSTA
jgi:hypothetical protein